MKHFLLLACLAATACQQADAEPDPEVRRKLADIEARLDKVEGFQSRSYEALSDRINSTNAKTDAPQRGNAVADLIAAKDNRETERRLDDLEASHGGTPPAR